MYQMKNLGRYKARKDKDIRCDFESEQQSDNIRDPWSAINSLSITVKPSCAPRLVNERADNLSAQIVDGELNSNLLR